MTNLPENWTLTASAFNWTPEVVQAECTARDIATSIVEDGIASIIEIEGGQSWRSFPAPEETEVDEWREALTRVGGGVSIVGASIDDWALPARRRDDDERFEFLLPQLRAARRLGASGIRLPIGQAGAPLLRRILPILHEFHLVLYEEIQGQQTPQHEEIASAIQDLAGLDDPRLRLLVDISLLMPALPPSYLDRLRSAGVSPALLDRLENDWRDPGTHAAVLATLHDQSVPPPVHTLFMNLIVRFGRSEASVLRDVLPLVGGFHLKFWDLDDGDERISRPIRELGELLAHQGFEGTLTSEWGGHEWLESETADDMTRRHLALARTALAEGAAAN